MPTTRSFPFRVTLPKRRFLTAIAIVWCSGLLMGLSTAPLNLFPLAWVALAPLWMLVFQPSRSPAWFSPAPLFLALIWGFSYHGLALSWITGLHPLTWLGIPWLGSVVITLLCWLVITLWGAMLVVIWAALLRVAARTPLQRVLIGTALWCGLEWLWGLGPLYWTSLSYTQSPGNRVILHLGQLSGPLTVTAAIAAVNGLLAEAWLRWQADRQKGETAREEYGEWAMESGQWGVGFRRERQPNGKGEWPRNSTGGKLAIRLASLSRLGGDLLGLALVVLVSGHLIGWGLASRPLLESAEAGLPVGIIQGNVPTRIKLFAAGLQQAESSYTRGYESLVAQGAEVILTPEGALPYIWNQSNRDRSRFYQAVLQHQVPVWLGTFTAEDGKIARSLLTLNGQGEMVSRYDKIKLVPLGEYVPLREVLGSLFRQLTTLEAQGLPGKLHQVMDTPFGRAIASICYDSAFPDVFRFQAAAGGQFILTASNLDPYSEVLMAQHQAQDLMRAIETDRWAVRATNTGYSGLINPRGQIIWRSTPHAFTTHLGTIYRRQTQTPYVRWGNWLTPVLLLLGCLTWLPPSWSNRKTRPMR